MKYSRCKWLTAVGLILATLEVFAGTPAGEVPLAKDLEREGRQAERACIPLLLEFSSLHCEYCTLLEDEVLKPTLLNRDYDRRVLMRKLVIDDASRLHDFDGKTIDASQLASRYKIFVTPTLVFVDRHGKELAERMVGVTTLEFFGGYLDQALDISREKLRTLNRCYD